MANNNPTPVWRNDRWIIQVQKNKVRHTFTSSIEGRKGKKECLDKYYAWLDGSAEGSKTLDRVFNEYIESLKNRKGEKCASYTGYQSFYKKHIPDDLKKKRMCKITINEWQDVINNDKDDKGNYLSKTTIEYHIRIISALIRFAYEDYQCDLPRKKLYIPKNRPPKKEKIVLTYEQVQRLFEPSDLWYHPLLKFMALYGLRPSEAMGLQEQDFNGNVLTINRGVTKEGYITEGKTDRARRKIYIGKYGMDIIRDTIERNKKAKVYSKWIFCGVDGDVGCLRVIEKNYRKLCKERDLQGTPYTLRHTWCSIFKDKMSEQSIKDIMGHSDNMPTFDIYGHFIVEDAKRNSAIIDDTFTKIFKSASKVHQANS